MKVDCIIMGQGIMPWLGRWLSCDPAGTVDGLNLFRFVNRNPIILTDNNGLDSDGGPPNENPRTNMNQTNQDRPPGNPGPSDFSYPEEGIGENLPTEADKTSPIKDEKDEPNPNSTLDHKPVPESVNRLITETIDEIIAGKTKLVKKLSEINDNLRMRLKNIPKTYRPGRQLSEHQRSGLSTLVNPRAGSKPTGRIVEAVGKLIDRNSKIIHQTSLLIQRLKFLKKILGPTIEIIAGNSDTDVTIDANGKISRSSFFDPNPSRLLTHGLDQFEMEMEYLFRETETQCPWPALSKNYSEDDLFMASLSFSWLPPLQIYAVWDIKEKLGEEHKWTDFLTILGPVYGYVGYLIN
jgi:hypothetical protein